ncbi:nucleoporin NUP637 [Plasmodium brasilianum]|uniref:Nucleoporin NUP637 n=1 Tax=Plasmodium brasilianum TaxID=5824 RepID=A0ACB9Y875_PLABR|nr:nucleoporin NUP637 [Plasmodium brasilianum]
MKDEEENKKGERPTIFYYEIYEKLCIYYDCAVNEKERKNKKFFKRKKTINELRNIQDELVEFVESNIDFISNPFYFLTYEEEDVNKNELKNYLASKYTNLLSFMDDIIKCAIILNRNVYYVCELFNNVYLKIEKDNIVNQVMKSEYICEIFKECIEKENLIIMIFLEILKYLNRNEKVGASKKHRHRNNRTATRNSTRSGTHDEYAKFGRYSERKTNITDNELKKPKYEEGKTSNVLSSSDNSLDSINISKKRSDSSLKKRINADRFSLYILILLTENDFIENIFLEIDKIIKFIIKYDDICDKIEYVFNYKTHKINILFNLIDILFLYYSKFQANTNIISKIFKLLNHLTIRNNKLIAQMDDYYKLDINMSDPTFIKMDELNDISLNANQPTSTILTHLNKNRLTDFVSAHSGGTVHQENVGVVRAAGAVGASSLSSSTTSVSPLTSEKGFLPSIVGSTGGGGCTNASTNIVLNNPLQSSLFSSNVETNSEKTGKNNAHDNNIQGSSGRSSSNNLMQSNNTNVNSIPKILINDEEKKSNDNVYNSIPPIDILEEESKDKRYKLYEQCNNNIKNSYYLNRCLDCSGYWYNCNCSLNDFDKSSLTLTTQISLLLILCLHPNIEKYVYEKRKNSNLESNNSSPVKEDENYLQELKEKKKKKKKKMDFHHFYIPDVWKYNCMSSQKEYKHLMSIKNTYSISTSFISENISYYYLLFTKINENRKKKNNMKVVDHTDDFWSSCGSGTVGGTSGGNSGGSVGARQVCTNCNRCSSVDSNIVLLKFVISLFTSNREEIFNTIFEDCFFKVTYDTILKRISSSTLIGSLIFHLFHLTFSFSFIKNSRTTDLWNTFIDYHIKKDFHIRNWKKSGTAGRNIMLYPSERVLCARCRMAGVNEVVDVVDKLDIGEGAGIGEVDEVEGGQVDETHEIGKVDQGNSSLVTLSNNIIYIYKKKGEYLIDVLNFLKIICNNYPRLNTNYVCILKNVINRYHSRIIEFSEFDETIYHHNLDRMNELGGGGKNESEKFFCLKESKYYNINEERKIILMKYRNLKVVADEKMKICLDFYSDVFVHILDFAAVLCNNIYDLKIIENIVLCFKTPLTANLNIFNLTKKLFNQFTCALSGKYNEFSKVTNKQHIYERTKNNEKVQINFLDEKFFHSGNSNMNSNMNSNRNSNSNDGIGIGIGSDNSGNFQLDRELYKNMLSKVSANSSVDGKKDMYSKGKDEHDDASSTFYFTYLYNFKISLLEKLFQQNSYLKEILKNNNLLHYLQTNNIYLSNLIKENELVEKHLHEKNIFKSYTAHYNSNNNAYWKNLSIENDYNNCIKEVNKILDDIEQSNSKLKLFVSCKSDAMQPIALGSTSISNTLTNPNHGTDGVSAVGRASGANAEGTTPLVEKKNLPNGNGTEENILEQMLKEKDCINYLLIENKLTENLLRENNFLKSEFTKYNIVDLFFKNKFGSALLDNLKSIMLSEYNVNQVLSYEEKFRSLRKNNDGSYNNKEAIKMFFDENKNAVDFFKEKKYEIPILKDDDSSTINENIMNRAKIILKTELQRERKRNIDARYLLTNIFERSFYPYNCIKMLEKCLLFLSSVNNNKLCYYLPINKNLLIDYILLEHYDGGTTTGVAATGIGGTTNANTVSTTPSSVNVEKLKAELKENNEYKLEDENRLFKIKNRKYNNLISLIDTQNMTNTTRFKNVFIHNLNMQNKMKEAKDKHVKQYKTMHLLDIIYEIIKTKYNPSIDMLNLKCICIEILCSSFVKNSSSALSVLCTLTELFPDIFIEIMKKYKEQKQNVKNKLDYIDRQISLGHIKNNKLQQLANNFDLPYFNLKIIITYMKCVNFLLYMIGIKRKFNLSLSKIWYFFNNIDKIEEIDAEIRRKGIRRGMRRDNYEYERSMNSVNCGAQSSSKPDSSSSNYIFFDIFFNFDLFFDELEGENDQEHEQEREQQDEEGGGGEAEGSGRYKGERTKLPTGLKDDPNDVFENFLRKKLMITDKEKNICKHLILLTNYIVQNIFYNLINNFILKKIRDKKYEKEDILEEDVKLEIFMNRQENAIFKRRYNYYIHKTKNIQDHIFTIQNEINLNNAHIQQIEQVFKQRNIPFEPYILSQKVFDKSFSDLASFDTSIISTRPYGESGIDIGTKTYLTGAGTNHSGFLNAASLVAGGGMVPGTTSTNVLPTNTATLFGDKDVLSSGKGFFSSNLTNVGEASSPFSLFKQGDKLGGTLSRASNLLTGNTGQSSIFGTSSNNLTLNSPGATGTGLFTTPATTASPSLSNSRTEYESSSRLPSNSQATTIFSSLLQPGSLQAGSMSTGASTGSTLNKGGTSIFFNTSLPGSSNMKSATGSNLFASNQTSTNFGGSTGLFASVTDPNVRDNNIINNINSSSGGIGGGLFGFSQNQSSTSNLALNDTNKLFGGTTSVGRGLFGNTNSMLTNASQNNSTPFGTGFSQLNTSNVGTNMMSSANSGGNNTTNLFGSISNNNIQGGAGGGGGLFGGKYANPNQTNTMQSSSSAFGNITNTMNNKPSLFSPVNQNSIFTNTFSVIPTSNSLQSSHFNTIRTGANVSTSSFLTSVSDNNSSNISNINRLNQNIGNSSSTNFSNFPSGGALTNQGFSNPMINQSTGLFSKNLLDTNSAMQNQQNASSLPSTSLFTFANKTPLPQSSFGLTGGMLSKSGTPFGSNNATSLFNPSSSTFTSTSSNSLFGGMRGTQNISPLSSTNDKATPGLFSGLSTGISGNTTIIGGNNTNQSLISFNNQDLSKVNPTTNSPFTANQFSTNPLSSNSSSVFSNLNQTSGMFSNTGRNFLPSGSLGSANNLMAYPMIHNLDQLKVYYEELKVKTNMLNAEVYKCKIELKKIERSIQKEKKIYIIKENKLREDKRKSDINFKDNEMYILIILVFIYFKLILKGPLPSNDNNKKINEIMNERYENLCDFRPTMYLFIEILGESSKFMNTFFNIIFLDNILHEENKDLNETVLRCKNYADYVSIYNQRKSLLLKKDLNDRETTTSTATAAATTATSTATAAATTATSTATAAATTATATTTDGASFSVGDNGEGSGVMEGRRINDVTWEIYYEKKLEYLTCSYSKEHYNSLFLYKIKELGLNLLKILFERDVLFIHMYNLWKNEKLLHKKIDKFHFDINIVDINNAERSIIPTATTTTGKDPDVDREINMSESLINKPVCIHNFLFKNININSRTTYLILLLKNFFRTNEINKIIIYFILQIFIRDSKTTINILKRDTDSFNFLKFALRNIFIFNLNRQKFNNCYIISNRTIKMQNVLNNFVDLPLLYFLNNSRNYHKRYCLHKTKNKNQYCKNASNSKRVLNTCNWANYMLREQRRGGNRQLRGEEEEKDGKDKQGKSDQSNHSNESNKLEVEKPIEGNASKVRSPHGRSTYLHNDRKLRTVCKSRLNKQEGTIAHDQHDHLEVSSIDVSSIDVSSIDVSSIDVSSIDVSSIDVSSIDVSSIDVSSIDDSSIDVSSNDVSSNDDDDEEEHPLESCANNKKMNVRKKKKFLKKNLLHLNNDLYEKIKYLKKYEQGMGGNYYYTSNNYKMDDAFISNYREFKMKKKKKQTKYIYDYLSDNDLIDTIKSKKICVFYDDKEKEEENDNLTFYNLISENYNDNYSKIDYYKELKSVDNNVIGYCSSYNLLPINNFYTEKYDFIESELVYVSDLKLYFYVKSYKRHAYYKKLLNIENVTEKRGGSKSDDNKYIYESSSSLSYNHPIQGNGIIHYNESGGGGTHTGLHYSSDSGIRGNSSRSGKSGRSGRIGRSGGFGRNSMLRSSNNGFNSVYPHNGSIIYGQELVDEHEKDKCSRENMISRQQKMHEMNMKKASMSSSGKKSMHTVNDDISYINRKTYNKTEEAKDIERIVDNEIKYYDFFNRLNKMNENMLFQNTFYDYRDDKMRYIDYIKKEVEKEKLGLTSSSSRNKKIGSSGINNSSNINSSIYNDSRGTNGGGDNSYKEGLLLPINDLLEAKKVETKKKLSTELRKKHIFLNNELCEWVELSHLLNVDIEYNNIRGANNNKILNNYSRIPITKLILYFFEVITRKYLFLNSSDSLLENCVLSLLGLSFIPSKQLDKKNVITSIDEGLELEEECFLKIMINNVIVNFSNFDHISELIHVDYCDSLGGSEAEGGGEGRDRTKRRDKRYFRGEGGNEEDDEDDEDDEDNKDDEDDKDENDEGIDDEQRLRPIGAISPRICKDNSEYYLKKKSTDYYKKNILLSNVNNYKQYNVFEKNCYFAKSLNIVYMISKNKKTKDYIITLINSMWTNKFNVFYYITQNVNVERLKDTEKILFFKISFHILNIFIPIIDNILNNIDKHVDYFMHLNFIPDELDNNMSNKATDKVEKKNIEYKCSNIYEFINKDNFNEKKSIFEFLNPIFNFDNIKNFINHYINIIKYYNDNYLKHYIYHYYLFNYDFSFQNVYNYSNMEHIHYIKNDHHPLDSLSTNSNNTVHVLYTNIINAYVNFCTLLKGFTNSYNSYTYNSVFSPSYLKGLYMSNDILNVQNKQEDLNELNAQVNYTRILSDDANEEDGKFNFKQMNEIIGNRNCLRRFLSKYYLSGRRSRSRNRGRSRCRSRFSMLENEGDGRKSRKAKSRELHYIEKNVYIFNSLNYLNINYKNWLLVYKIYIEKITCLVDIVLKIKNNNMNKKFYYLKNYFYIINNIQKHLKNITTIIKSSYYINFNIQITPILFIVYLFITIFFFSHNNNFAFNYFSYIKKGFKNLFFKHKKDFPLKNLQIDGSQVTGKEKEEGHHDNDENGGGDDEDDDNDDDYDYDDSKDEGGTKQKSTIKGWKKQVQHENNKESSRSNNNIGGSSSTNWEIGDELKIENLKYHKKLKMNNSLFSKKILNKEFQSNLLNIPKNMNNNGDGSSGNWGSSSNTAILLENDYVFLHRDLPYRGPTEAVHPGSRSSSMYGYPFVSRGLYSNESSNVIGNTGHMRNMYEIHNFGNNNFSRKTEGNAYTSGIFPGRHHHDIVHMNNLYPVGIGAMSNNWLSSNEKKVYYDVHNEYSKLILRSNEFFDDMLELLIILITKKHPILNKYTVIYIYECLYTLLNIYHYNYMYNEDYNNVQKKNMFLSLIKKIDQDILNDFISTLFIDSYKNFFTNKNSIIPIYFYNSIYKFIDYNTEVFMYNHSGEEDTTNMKEGFLLRTTRNSNIHPEGKNCVRRKSLAVEENKIFAHNKGHGYSTLLEKKSIGRELNEGRRKKEAQYCSSNINGIKRNVGEEEEQKDTEGEDEFYDNEFDYNYNGSMNKIVNVNFKNNLNNKIHLNNKSLNIYEEVYCFNFLYNRNDLNLLSINLLIFLLNKIGIYEINIKIDENNIKNLIKGNLFIFNRNIEKQNENKMLHTCFLLSSLCDTTYINEFVSKEDLFSLFLKSNIFDNLYEFKFNYLSTSISFLTFPTNFLENKNIYIPLPMLIISYITVILKVVDKKGLYLFKIIGKWINKNVNIFVNNLIVNNYLMKSNEIIHEVNNFTTYNHTLVYKCLCYSSTCNFTREKKSGGCRSGSSGCGDRGGSVNSNRNNSGCVNMKTNESGNSNNNRGDNSNSSGIEEKNANIYLERYSSRNQKNEKKNNLFVNINKDVHHEDKRTTEEHINHANINLVNLDIIYTCTYYLLRLYKNYLLYIHQNYLTLKKLKIIETRKRTTKKKKKKKQSRRAKLKQQEQSLESVLELDNEEDDDEDDDEYEDGNDEDEEEDNDEHECKHNDEQNSYPHNYHHLEQRLYYNHSEEEEARRGRINGRRERINEQVEERNYNDDQLEEGEEIHVGKMTKYGEYTSKINNALLYNDSNNMDKLGNYHLGNYHDSSCEYYNRFMKEEEGFFLDNSLSFDFDEISLNICNIIKEHIYILQYIKDLLNILSIFVIYDISLKDENDLLNKNLNNSMLEKRKKNIRTHRILQNIIPKYSIKFHCINLCLDIIEYDIGLYDEYVQQSKTKYYEYIKIVLKVFMNTCFYFINIIKFENFHMLKSVSMAMKKLTNIIYFLLNNLTIKEKPDEHKTGGGITDSDKTGANNTNEGETSESKTDANITSEQRTNEQNSFLLNKFIYDKSGFKKNAHEITTELFNSEYSIFNDKKCSSDNIKKFLENIEIDIHVLKKILTCVIYFTYAMLSNQKVNKINIENINLNHINKINIKKIANTYLENNNILKRSTQIYYLLYSYATKTYK